MASNARKDTDCLFNRRRSKHKLQKYAGVCQKTCKFRTVRLTPEPRAHLHSHRICVCMSCERIACTPLFANQIVFLCACKCAHVPSFFFLCVFVCACACVLACLRV